MNEDFWLKVLFFSIVILWSLMVIGIFLLLVRLAFHWYDGFSFFGVYFAPPD